MNRNIGRKLEELLSNAGDVTLRRRIKEMVEGLNLQPGDYVIDLGCGDGYLLHILSSLPIKIKLAGIDNDKKVISNAFTNLKKRRIPIEHGSLTKLPFKDNTFDKALLSEVIEHINDDLRVFQEIKRVLKPGGIIVLTTPNYNYPFFWDPVNWIGEHVFGTHFKAGFFSGIWFGHIRLYKMQQLEDVIKKSGLEVKKSEKLTSWCLPFNHYLVNIVARFILDFNLPKEITNNVNKFSTNKKPSIIRFFFNAVKLYDGLNDLIPFGEGVTLFIKATKK